MVDRLEAYFTGGAPRSLDEINRAFRGACHGGQRQTAQYLLDRGADLNWIPPWEDSTPLDAAVRSNETELAQWLRGRGARWGSELR